MTGVFRFLIRLAKTNEYIFVKEIKKKCLESVTYKVTV